MHKHHARKFSRKQRARFFCSLRAASTSQTGKGERLSVKYQKPHPSNLNDRCTFQHTNYLSKQLLEGLSMPTDMKIMKTASDNELCCSAVDQAFLSWLLIITLTSGSACSPSEKRPTTLLIFLWQDRALWSDGTLSFRQAGVSSHPSPLLAPHGLPTPPHVEAGSKYLSNLHCSGSVMTRAIKTTINASESANLSFPPCSALGFCFVLALFSPLPPFPRKCDEGGWGGSSYVQIFRQSLSNKWVSVSSIICLAVALIICCEL